MLGRLRFAVRPDFAVAMIAELRAGVRVVAVAAAFGVCSEASAAAFQVYARTEAQAYHLRSWRGTGPGAPVLLPRRRLVQTLGLNVYEVVTGQDLSFESSVRVWADFGLPRSDLPHLDNVRNEDADLTKASLVYRSGSFEGELGRQLSFDAMDLFAFDGLRLRYFAPFGLGAEAYAGLWVKGTSFLGSDVYQPDGTRETDARRLAVGVPLANPVLDDLEPLFGGRLLFRSRLLRASAGYRRALVTRKVDLERVVAEVDVGPIARVTAFAGADFDLILGQLANARAELRYDGTVFALSAEAMRSTLLLSTDSIFYSFSRAPRDELRLGGDVFPIAPLRLYGRVLGARYGLDLAEGCETCELSVAVAQQFIPRNTTQLGFNAGATWSAGEWRTGLDTVWRQGQGGTHFLIDLNGRYAPALSRFSADLRLTFARVRDQVNQRLRGDFYGAQLGGSYALSPLAKATVVIEENINPFTRSDFKVFAFLDFRGAL